MSGVEGLRQLQVTAARSSSLEGRLWKANEENK